MSKCIILTEKFLAKVFLPRIHLNQFYTFQDLAHKSHSSIRNVY